MKRVKLLISIFGSLLQKHWAQLYFFGVNEKQKIITLENFDSQVQVQKQRRNLIIWNLQKYL
jgi:hypothetical protein